MGSESRAQRQGLSATLNEPYRYVQVAIRRPPVLKLVFDGFGATIKKFPAFMEHVCGEFGSVRRLVVCFLNENYPNPTKNL